MTYQPASIRPRAIANWLLFMAAAIVGMVIIGGITRLTESGLSIVEWKPVTGIIPPLNHAEWMVEFEKYRQSSQYAMMNQGMTLEAFKRIFFWEYIHRVYGRMLGFLYFIPMVWFFVKGAVPKGYALRLIVLLLLGGAQGAVGWLMVASGLTDRVNVEPAMLAAHLVMALILLSGVVWTACDMLRLARNPNAGKARITLWPMVAIGILFVQIFFGAITAGLRAGYISNTWPLMNDHFVPEGIQSHGSIWMTLTSDPFLIHFLHRWWAWVALAAMILLARAAKKAGDRKASVALNIVAGTQVLLGIATVLTNIHIHTAVTHQAVAAILLGVAVWAANSVGAVRR